MYFTGGSLAPVDLYIKSWMGNVKYTISTKEHSDAV